MATYYRWWKYEYGWEAVKVDDFDDYHFLVGYDKDGKSLAMPVYYGDTEPTIDENGNFTGLTYTADYPVDGSGHKYIAMEDTPGLSTVGEEDELWPKRYYCADRGNLTISENRFSNNIEYEIVNTGDSSATGFYAYTPQKQKGGFLGYVYSTSSSAYPNGGGSGDYYYDWRTTVTSPTAPTGLTYPATITTPSVSVSWTAATSNVPNYTVSLYEVSYSTNNGDSWTVAGTTAETSYSFNIPAGTTSLIFRVRAKDSNGQWGSYVTGTESQVILAPDLTVPQMVMQGQQATISWTAIEGADSYILQRKANTDTDWTQVYSGANLTFSEAVGTWTTVQYRVQAVFDGTPGGWAESAAIPVVSSSALVISGTDENLGVVTNDIPYSISTDTGNQITATITVNNAVIFSGNVGNSTADVIPVLDLITGEGTIVISATVDASGSPVTATRTWTYEKAAITFPNSGSVAQVTKEGENIYPKVLAEGVRLPGGKTLDQVMGFPAQIYTGSYVGTGTSGSSNPTILTFPFEPKIVFIARGTTPSGGSLGTITPMIRGVQQSIVGINGSSRSIAYLTWDNNSLSFYGNGGADTSLNESGITYHYVAIG